LRTLDDQRTESYSRAVSIQQENDAHSWTVSYYFNEYWRFISLGKEYLSMEKQIAVLKRASTQHPSYA